MSRYDINMIPKKKKVPASITVGIPFAILISILIIAAGIYLPTSYLDMKKQDLKSIQTQLDAYGDVSTEYNDTILNLNNLSSELNSLQSFLSKNKTVLTMKNVIDTNTPSGIEILSMEFTGEFIELAGIAQSDLRIADFEDAMWDTAEFSRIDLTSIDGSQGERTFVFTLIYKVENDQGGEQ